MDLKLKGKRALVCGASKGLGRAIAESLAKEGTDLFLLARDEQALSELTPKLKELGAGRVAHAVCDLLDETSRDKAIKSVQKDFHGLDILIHNVGGPKATFAEETPAAEWQEGFNRLFQTVVYLNSAFLPDMKKQGWGRIITVTSLSVIEPIPFLAISNAMRSASTALSKTLADEVGKFGVTVNCVAPGMVSTGRIEDLLEARIQKSGQSREQYMEEVLKTIPAGRLGKPEEFAAAVAFLCSEQAAYITGSTICVDGGKRRSTC